MVADMRNILKPSRRTPILAHTFVDTHTCVHMCVCVCVCVCMDWGIYIQYMLQECTEL